MYPDLVMTDDYVLPSEPVMDYLTRFSGLTPEDLDPAHSRHHLVTNRTAYLKLRYLIDRGCVLVGHGLKKDFRIINIFVPPSQVSPPSTAGVQLFRFHYHPVGKKQS